MFNQKSAAWDKFLMSNKDDLLTNSEYEYRFVNEVLRHVANIEAKDVQMQYCFTDCRGKRRYIDFVIIFRGKPKIAIEVDGYDKRGFGGMTPDEFNDFTFRQNEITGKGLHALRFANGEFVARPHQAIVQIEQAVERVWKELKPGVLARGLGKITTGIIGEVEHFVDGFTSGYTESRKDRAEKRAAVREAIMRKIQERRKQENAK